MDSERFDTITRTLASSNSRRGVVRTLTGAAVGGLLVAVGIGEAEAKKKHGGRHSVTAQGRPCKNGGIPCGKGKNFQCCLNGDTCSGGECVTVPCPPYKIRSAGVCVYPCDENPCAACGSGSGDCKGNADGSYICAMNYAGELRENCPVNGCNTGFTCYSGSHRADSEFGDKSEFDCYKIITSEAC